MAKDKKAAKELTMEEKLAQALVPVEEQPYKIPENWCWTTVDKVSRVITGSTPSKKILSIMEQSSLFSNLLIWTLDGMYIMHRNICQKKEKKFLG